MQVVELSEVRQKHGATQGSSPPHDPRTRYTDGWRAGKPAEDPEKTKRWGLISVRPSEYLIHMRRGEVLEKSSGQGASCFKWPWDSVAIVPTTVQRMRFTADQVTSEKVGVQVTGLAVYRIAAPLIAYRMLNFSFPERASEKLEQMLAEMFVGAARRLVANLTVEQCLTKRKEGIAGELMREIAPVVSGSGRPEDRTARGWGVVLDTIEIQDVRVLSQAVFTNMQARYRQELERAAREAELATERAVKHGQAEAERQVALTRLAAEAEVRQRKQVTDEQARLGQLEAEARAVEAKIAHERALAQARMEAEVEKARLELASSTAKHQTERAAAEARAAAARKDAELRREAERAEELGRLALEDEAATARRAQERAEAQARHEAQMAEAVARHQALQAQAEVETQRRLVAAAELEVAELVARRLHVEHEVELTRARAGREIENSISAEAIQLQVARELPALAAAFQQKMGTVNVTAVDGANPFGYIASAVQGVIGLARSAGLGLPPPSAGEPSAIPPL